MCMHNRILKKVEKNLSQTHKVTVIDTKYKRIMVNSFIFKKEIT